MVMDATTLYLSTAVLGLLLILLLVPRVKRALRDGELPEPRGYPLLGHLLSIRAWGSARGDRLPYTLRRWADQHGGAFQLRTSWLGRLLYGGPRVVVVLSDPDAVHALLALGEDAAVKSRRYYSGLDWVLHPDGEPSSATAATAPQWALIRRSLLHAFSDDELRQDFEVAKAKSLLLAQQLQGLGPGVVVDVGDSALRLSLDVAGLSKLGYDFEAVESRGEVLMVGLLGEVAGEWDVRRRRLLPPSLAPWLDDTAAAGLNKCRILQAFIEQELWADIDARGPPPPDDVTLAAQLARLRMPPARSTGPAGPSAAAAAAPLSQSRTLSELAAQLLMAHEPTGHAIAWSLHCVAGNKAVQDKLVAELKREGVFDRPQDLTYDKLPRLPYLDAVVRESLRLYPTQACPATVRLIKKDVTLAGRWRLPALSEVWVDVFSMHRSPRLWAAPDKFNPERWAAPPQASPMVVAEGTDSPPRQYDGLCTVEPDPGSAAAAAAVAATPAAQLAQPPVEPAGPATEPPLRSPRAFMPFGSGPRSCLGQRLAVAEVKAAVVVLLSQLILEPPPAAAAGAEVEEPQMWQGLFLRPVGGLHLLVAPRKRGSA